MKRDDAREAANILLGTVKGCELIANTLNGYGAEEEDKLREIRFYLSTVTEAVNNFIKLRVKNHG